MPAIQGVPEDGTSDVAHVDAKLMRAPGPRGKKDVGVHVPACGECPQHTVPGDGLSSA